MCADRTSITPAMQQYIATKEKYSDCIVLFRMGDFYEMFFEDAHEASKLLDLTLTSRDKDAPSPIPMAGFPAHAVAPYVRKLLDNNKKIAICDQVEDPKKAKGLVRREVVQVITPGVQVDSENMDARIPNNLVAVCFDSGMFFFASADASTGSFRGAMFSAESDFLNAIAGCEPKEAIVQKNSAKLISLLGRNAPSLFINEVRDDYFQPAQTCLLQTADIAREQVRMCASAVIRYLKETQEGLLNNLKPFEFIASGDICIIDENSVRNLEIFRTIVGSDRKGSLLHLMDRTLTSMGARMLRERLRSPLISSAKINERLDTVEYFHTRSILREELRTLMAEIADIERIMGKISANACNARDLAGLGKSLGSIQKIKNIFIQHISSEKDIGNNASVIPTINSILENLDPLTGLADKIISTFVDSPPVAIKEGGMIRSGVDPELDKLLLASREGKEWFLRYEEKERKRTGIPNLKVRYNRVFGYVIEVTRSYLSRVKEDYVRKQTVANAERFFTPELKEYEDLVLNAEEKIAQREYEIFQSVRTDILSESGQIHRTARAVAELDFFLALAELAVTKCYSRPRINDGNSLIIKDGRHPVVEEMLAAGRFVPNDINLDEKDSRMIIITGPNMAGKSTVIRQAALMVIMAQTGSFIPAREAEIGTADRIFTRIGAVDDLARGRSTFMVEMNETAEILKYSTKKSLILLDEIGRGTSTYDGISIAWAVAEYIHNKIGARTLFATHYHELTEITKTLPMAKNYSVAVKEWNDEVIFLRKLKEGPTSRSYGIQVGKLAGLPENVINRAREILKNLETSGSDAEVQSENKKNRIKCSSDRQISLFGDEKIIHSDEQKHSEIINELSAQEIDILSPLEALNLISAWKRKLKT